MGISGMTNTYPSNVTYSTEAKNNTIDKSQKDGAASGAVSRENDATANFYSQLQKNCPAMKNGNVSISGEYLKQCTADPQKAKELEEFIKSIPEKEKQGYEQLSAQNKGLGGTVTYYQQSWVINKDGSIQSTVYSVTDTGTSNAEKMKKSMDERLEKQKEKLLKEKESAEKKEKEDKLEEVSNHSGGIQTEKEINNINMKYVRTDSIEEAEKLIRRDKAVDAYQPSVDLRI